MQIQVNTDSRVEGSEKLSAYLRGVVEKALSHYSDRITRVEVHLSDQKAGKRAPGGKRCMMEARLTGRSPTAVTHDAESLDHAIDGAAIKIQRAIESELGRLRDQG